MSRRSSLPGAAELFRPTVEPTTVAVADPGADEATPVVPVRPSHLTPVPAGGDLRPSPSHPEDARAVRQSAARPARRTVGDRQPSGRERHDEKITVYVSPGELVDLEQARLTLRAEHGLVVDRGRIVREALAVVLADLDSFGSASTLVRRLTGS